MSFDPDGKSADQILDYGAPGLEYWEQFLPRYAEAFDAHRDTTLSSLQAAYDEQRGTDLPQLGTVATELAAALAAAESQWSAQWAAAQTLPTLWTGPAGTEAQTTLIVHLRRARTDLDAANTAATALAALIDPLRQAVLTKAESTLALRDHTASGTGELAIEGKSPRDVDALIADKATYWLTTTFKPDVEHKLDTFATLCEATAATFESHYATATTALAQILDLPYPHPAALPAPTAPTPSQSESLPSQPHQASPAPVGGDAGVGAAPGTVPAATAGIPPNVAAGSMPPGVVDHVPSRGSTQPYPNQWEPQPYQPQPNSDPRRRATVPPDSATSAQSAFTTECPAQSRSVPNPAPEYVPSARSAPTSDPGQQAPSSLPGDAAATRPNPAASGEPTTSIDRTGQDSHPDSSANPLSALTGLIKSLISGLDLTGLTDLLHSSTTVGDPPTPDPNNPADSTDDQPSHPAADRAKHATPQPDTGSNGDSADSTPLPDSAQLAPNNPASTPNPDGRCPPQIPACPQSPDAKTQAPQEGCQPPTPSPDDQTPVGTCPAPSADSAEAPHSGCPPSHPERIDQPNPGCATAGAAPAVCTAPPADGVDNRCSPPPSECSDRPNADGAGQNSECPPGSGAISPPQPADCSPADSSLPHRDCLPVPGSDAPAVDHPGAGKVPPTLGDAVPPAPDGVTPAPADPPAPDGSWTAPTPENPAPEGNPPLDDHGDTAVEIPDSGLEIPEVPPASIED